jgi:hypothetical protein
MITSVERERGAELACDQESSSEVSCCHQRPSSNTTHTMADDQPAIGLIGMGDMGKMYARRLIQGGWTRFVFPLPPLALARRSP